MVFFFVMRNVVVFQFNCIEIKSCSRNDIIVKYMYVECNSLILSFSIQQFYFFDFQEDEGRQTTERRSSSCTLPLPRCRPITNIRPSRGPVPYPIY